LFHTYEEYANQWGSVIETKFSTCVPFKGKILPSIVEDEIKPFLDFVREIIANNNAELYIWLIKWIAHIYKYPNSRTRCALILLSLEEGTGKGTFCDILTYIFGIHNIDQSGGSVKSLVSERSSHLVGKKFAMVQEMRENKGDYMGCMEALKTFITDDYIAVRPLYANKMTVRNLVELIMTTNNENILKTSVEGRRFTVAKVSASRKQDNAYFRGLKEHCQTQSFIDNFATYLMKVDVREGSIKALATEALVDMAEASQDSIAAYWSDMMSQTLYEIKQDLHFVVVDESVSISRKIAYDSYKQWCASNNEIVYKNRKFQSDTATIANIECYRNSTDRYWLIHVSE
jgi:phage/plasmid-associated DNA primase